MPEEVQAQVKEKPKIKRVVILEFEIVPDDELSPYTCSDSVAKNWVKYWANARIEEREL